MYYLLKRCLQSLAFSITLLGPLLGLQGTLKALQKQEVAYKILLLSLYGVSLPAAYILSCVIEIGVTGLWTGFAIGQTVIVLLYLAEYLKTDWKAVFKLNQDRRSLD